MKTKPTYQNVEALAADLNFINWVRKESGSPEGLWFEELTAQDNVEWIEPAKHLVNSVSFREMKVEKSSLDRMWQHIDSEVQENTEKSSQANVFRLPLRIAAGIALLISVFAYWWINASDIQGLQTQYAETASIDLPDGSAVTLNADSELSFDEDHWEAKRTVNLHGEGFFEVAKGEKFTVKTDAGRIEVLGTSFNVIHRESIFQVSCHSGKVRVVHNSEKVILEAGDEVQLINGQLVRSAFQVDPEKTWMKGYFIYENARLEEVFDEIERQFDVRIDDSEVDVNRNYSGFFVRKNLSEALQAVCWPLRLNFDLQGNEVKISEDPK